MAKKLMCLFLFITMIILTNAAAVYADEVASGDGSWYYTATADGKAENVHPADKTTLTGAVTVPTNLDGKPVISIAEEAFSGNAAITSVQLPDTISAISRKAFADCTLLASVNIPGAVTSIGGNAFSGCYKLASVNIPEGVKKIEYGTFAYTNLSTVTVPSTVTYVDNYAFYCTNLKSIQFTNPATVIFQAASTIGDKAIIEGDVESTAHDYANAFSRIFTDKNAVKTSDVSVNSPATIIDVTITVNSDISIDPRTGTVSSPTITIKNNTKSPIDLTSTGVSIDGYFTLVEPGKYTDAGWASLTREESKQIAVILTMQGQWKNIINGEYRSNTSGSGLHGTLAPGAEAIISSQIKHGNSFADRVKSKLTISWLVTLE